MNFLKKLFGKKEPVSQKAAPVPEPQSTPQPSEDHSEEIARISALLSGLFDCLKAVLEEELEVFKAEADAFYASPESRDAETCIAFREAALSRRNEKAEEAGQAYIRAQGAEATEYYAAAQENYMSHSSDLPGGQQCYARLAWAYLVHSKLTQEEKRAVREEGARALQKLESQWYKAMSDAVCRHWKPIRVLSGAHGSYDRCVCFDEEFGCFFALSPDDNYYHWGSYDMYAITTAEAEKRVGCSLANLSAVPTPSCCKSYFREYEIPEIRDRIV